MNKLPVLVLDICFDLIASFTCSILADNAMIRFPLSTFFFTLINTSDVIHVASIVGGNTLSDLQFLLSWCTDKRVVKPHLIFAHHILV